MLSLSHRLTHLIVWLRRIRHRHGYGIHSPWAFSLVTQVIYCRLPYYDYKPLQRQFRLGYSRLRQAQLLLRLSNFQQPSTIHIAPSLPDAEQAYLLAGCKKATIVTDSTDDMIHLDDSLTIILNLPHHTTEFATMKPAADRTVTFDLYYLALIFNHLPLSRQDYIINY